MRFTVFIAASIFVAYIAKFLLGRIAVPVDMFFLRDLGARMGPFRYAVVLCIDYVRD
jgi:hypothetical protein